MPKIKICGMRRIDDIEMVNEFMPDFVGFIFFNKSKRFVTEEDASKMVDKLSNNIKKVGVFVNETKENIINTANTLNLDIVQLHGSETPEFCVSLGIPYWKVFSIEDIIPIEEINTFVTNTILLDTNFKGITGGTGKTFDWKLLKDGQLEKHIVLAGGLNPENISQAIKMINPYCLDVNSGIETNGFKDYNKMKKLFENIKNIRSINTNLYM